MEFILVNTLLLLGGISPPPRYTSKLEIHNAYDDIVGITRVFYGQVEKVHHEMVGVESLGSRLAMEKLAKNKKY